MGVFWILLGVIAVIISLVMSVISIASRSYNPLAIVFLLVGLLLIRIGRATH